MTRSGRDGTARRPTCTDFLRSMAAAAVQDSCRFSCSSDHASSSHERRCTSGRRIDVRLAATPNRVSQQPARANPKAPHYPALWAALPCALRIIDLPGPHPDRPACRAARRAGPASRHAPLRPSVPLQHGVAAARRRAGPRVTRAGEARHPQRIPSAGPFPIIKDKFCMRARLCRVPCFRACRMAGPGWPAGQACHAGGGRMLGQGGGMDPRPKQRISVFIAIV